MGRSRLLRSSIRLGCIPNRESASLASPTEGRPAGLMVESQWRLTGCKTAEHSEDRALTLRYLCAAKNHMPCGGAGANVYERAQAPRIPDPADGHGGHGVECAAAAEPFYGPAH
jgi:hypothetical protein